MYIISLIQDYLYRYLVKILDVRDLSWLCYILLEFSFEFLIIILCFLSTCFIRKGIELITLRRNDIFLSGIFFSFLLVIFCKKCPRRLSWDDLKRGRDFFFIILFFWRDKNNTLEYKIDIFRDIYFLITGTGRGLFFDRVPFQ